MNRYLLTLALSPFAANPEAPVPRATLEQKWRVRIQSLLDQGKFPIIDWSRVCLARKGATTFPPLRHLPDEAKHNISYRNTWRLLTGNSW